MRELLDVIAVVGPRQVGKTDPELGAHLLGINEVADLDSPGGKLRGRLFETLVMNA